MSASNHFFGATCIAALGLWASPMAADNKPINQQQDKYQQSSFSHGLSSLLLFGQN